MPAKACKAMHAQSSYTLFDALLKDIYVIRPNSELVHRQVSDRHQVLCIERKEDRTVLHFILSRSPTSVSLYCAKPQHPYVSVIWPSDSFSTARFAGRMRYVNKKTGNVVDTAYALDRAWWLHGLPRNIEHGLAKAV